MARAHLRHILKDTQGNAVQNARVKLYVVGTTTPISDAWNATSGGSAVTELVSNVQGEVEAWLDNAKQVDLVVTDNSGTAYLSGASQTRLTFTDVRETVDVFPSADILLYTTATAQTKEGDLRVRTVVTKEAPLDVTHPFFGGKCDYVTDDTAAWQALINHIGDTALWRSAEIAPTPGPSVISSTLLFEKKNIRFLGGNVGSPNGTPSTAGSWFVWQGTTTAPMLRFRQCYMPELGNLGLVNTQTDPARIPDAAISFDHVTGTANSKPLLGNIWIGAYLSDPDPAAGTYYFTNGIKIEGANGNNDQGLINNLHIQHCQTGMRIGSTTNTQGVLWTINHAHIRECETGLYTVCQVHLNDPVFALNVGRDLDLNPPTGATARVTIDRFFCEASGQMARIRGSSQLIIRSGSFGYSNALTGSGSAGDIRVIDADGDVIHQTVMLEDFSFRSLNYTNPGTPRFLAIGFNGASGALFRKEAELRRVSVHTRYLEPSDILVSLAGTSGNVYLYGDVYGVKNVSGFSDTQRFFNVLTPTDSTPDFKRNDLLRMGGAPVRAKAGVPVDADFPATPLDNVLAIDTGTDRLYYRKAGTFTSTAVSGLPQALRMTADVAATTNTRVNLTGLSFSIAANETRYLDIWLIYDTTTANDIQVGFSLPSGATFSIAGYGASVSATTNAATPSQAVIHNAASGSASYGGGRAAGAAQLKMILHLVATVTASSTAGTVQVTAGKINNTDTASPADDCTIFAGSRMVVI